MAKLSVFDPPMCCSTGICGPAVDPVLPRVAADLDWLKGQGVTIERANLSQQPAAFAGNPTVIGALREFGNDCLPLILVDDRVAVSGRYPERAELARLAGLDIVIVETDEAPDPAKNSCCSEPASSPVVSIGGRAETDQP